jgi:hypothetical protein
VVVALPIVGGTGLLLVGPEAIEGMFGGSGHCTVRQRLLIATNVKNFFKNKALAANFLRF